MQVNEYAAWSLEDLKQAAASVDAAPLHGAGTAFTDGEQILASVAQQLQSAVNYLAEGWRGTAAQAAIGNAQKAYSTMDATRFTAADANGQTTEYQAKVRDKQAAIAAIPDVDTSWTKAMSTGGIAGPIGIAIAQHQKHEEYERNRDRAASLVSQMDNDGHAHAEAMESKPWAGARARFAPPGPLPPPPGVSGPSAQDRSGTTSGVSYSLPRGRSGGTTRSGSGTRNGPSSSDGSLQGVGHTTQDQHTSPAGHAGPAAVIHPVSAPVIDSRDDQVTPVSAAPGLSPSLPAAAASGEGTAVAPVATGGLSAAGGLLGGAGALAAGGFARRSTGALATGPDTRRQMPGDLNEVPANRLGGSGIGNPGGSVAPGERPVTEPIARPVGQLAMGESGRPVSGYPMGAGAGRRDDDEDELAARPDYLVETDDIWGEGRLASPPVLG